MIPKKAFPPTTNRHLFHLLTERLASQQRSPTNRQAPVAVSVPVSSTGHGLLRPEDYGGHFPVPVQCQCHQQHIGQYRDDGLHV